MKPLLNHVLSVGAFLDPVQVFMWLQYFSVLCIPISSGQKVCYISLFTACLLILYSVPHCVASLFSFAQMVSSSKTTAQCGSQPRSRGLFIWTFENLLVPACQREIGSVDNTNIFNFLLSDIEEMCQQRGPTASKHWSLTSNNLDSTSALLRSHRRSTTFISFRSRSAQKGTPILLSNVKNFFFSFCIAGSTILCGAKQKAWSLSVLEWWRQPLWVSILLIMDLPLFGYKLFALITQLVHMVTVQCRWAFYVNDRWSVVHHPLHHLNACVSMLAGSIFFSGCPPNPLMFIQCWKNASGAISFTFTSYQWLQPKINHNSRSRLFQVKVQG